MPGIWFVDGATRFGEENAGCPVNCTLGKQQITYDCNCVSPRMCAVGSTGTETGDKNLLEF